MRLLPSIAVFCLFLSGCHSPRDHQPLPFRRLAAITFLGRPTPSYVHSCLEIDSLGKCLIAYDSLRFPASPSHFRYFEDTLSVTVDSLIRSIDFLALDSVYDYPSSTIRIDGPFEHCLMVEYSNNVRKYVLLLPGESPTPLRNLVYSLDAIAFHPNRNKREPFDFTDIMVQMPAGKPHIPKIGPPAQVQGN